MGTRADFYVGRGKKAEWIGSIAWDGHPDSRAKVLWRVNKESVFRSRVAKILGDKEGGPTKPEQGWPWPWEDSNTTDYAYAFDDGRVWGTCFGQGWWPIEKEPAESDDTAQVEFPDMTSRKKMAPPGSNRSGIMVIGPKQP